MYCKNLQICSEKNGGLDLKNVHQERVKFVSGNKENVKKLIKYAFDQLKAKINLLDDKSMRFYQVYEYAS